MRLLLQRVREGKVTIEGQDVGNYLGKGLVVLVGFGPEDTLALRGGQTLEYADRKMVGLRIFLTTREDEQRDRGGWRGNHSGFPVHAVRGLPKGTSPFIPPVGPSGRGGTVVSAICGRCAIQTAGTGSAGRVRCGYGRFPHELGACNDLIGLSRF